MDCALKYIGSPALLSILAAIVMAVCSESCRGADADPAKLPKQRADAIGYPSRDPNLDVRPGFVEPPVGYGEVPFYWWLGDPLTRERLAWHLEQFKGMGISGLQINYAHSDKGGLFWGLTYPNDPPLFSDAWWKLVQWWSGECQKQNIAISLSDYTLQGVGQGHWTDEILAENPDMRGRLLDCDVREVSGGSKLEFQLPENTISVVAFRVTDGKIQPGSGVDLHSAVTGRALSWTAPEGRWRVVAIFARVVQNSLDPINPKTGPKIIEKHFGRFEQHLPGQAGKGLNFFFSDELDFGIRGHLWDDRFAAEFKKRKGYDITPKLAALFDDIGPETPKIRLDYSDVMISLEEESYFEPVFRWHYDRGMVYGCDHGGRGRDVTEFGDYFRTQRWMTGPGCDQPALADDIIKDKVASSIAHLYQRPRTWLEGYHSSGWGTNTAQLTDATFKNFAMGQNLLSLHGLYYSTHGGFWEWAPPCNHFRMPYWAHMDKWFKCIRRLSYLMSQGAHRCDVAIVYPVAPLEAGMDSGDAVGTAFGVGERLYRQGIDFDFIDFESLGRAKCRDKELHVSGEAYKVLVLPAMQAVRWSTIQKAVEFKKAGGIVVAIGALPEASDRAGRDDAELTKTVNELFGTSASSYDDLAKTINESVDRDFIPSNGCYVNHRKVGKRDVYMVVGAKKGSECFFRAKGRVELWDPWTGRNTGLYVISQSDDGTRLRMPLDASEAQIIVFAPGEHLRIAVPRTDLDELGTLRIDLGEVSLEGYSHTPGRKSATVVDGNLTYDLAGEAKAPETIRLDEPWEFELKPTMDNRFGDFRLPITDRIIGAEARRFGYEEDSSPDPGLENPSSQKGRDWPLKTYEFGQKFWKLGPLSKDADTTELEAELAKTKSIDPAIPVKVGDRQYQWQPYEYGLRQGVEGDPGHEGYHGLKECISDDFIALGNRNYGNTDTWYSNKSDSASRYYLWTAVRSDRGVQARIAAGGMMPSGVWLDGRKVKDLASPVNVAEGSTPLLLRYEQAGRGHFVLQTGEDKPGPRVPLSMTWYCKPGVLQFDPKPEVDNPVGWYRFTVPPGLKSMRVFAHGRLSAWADGHPMTVTDKGRRFDGATEYAVTAGLALTKPALVVLRIEQERGYYGGAAIPEPIALDCGPGLVSLGDWCQYGLECYSGGAWYRKTVDLSETQAKGCVTLKLGDLVSSAEVHVNGKPAGVRLAPPWDFDISDYVKTGRNMIEVLVYNTLANHYVTIPTRYRGDIRSGLIGPASIEVGYPVVLTSGPKQ